MVLDEGIEVDHEALLGLKLHQVGQILDGLGHQLQGAVCRGTGRVCMGKGVPMGCFKGGAVVLRESRGKGL